MYSRLGRPFWTSTRSGRQVAWSREHFPLLALCHRQWELRTLENGWWSAMTSSGAARSLAGHVDLAHRSQRCGPEPAGEYQSSSASNDSIWSESAYKKLLASSETDLNRGNLMIVSVTATPGTPPPPPHSFGTISSDAGHLILHILSANIMLLMIHFLWGSVARYQPKWLSSLQYCLNLRSQERPTCCCQSFWNPLLHASFLCSCECFTYLVQLWQGPIFCVLQSR